jgi:hypothetical protein
MKIKRRKKRSIGQLEKVSLSRQQRRIKSLELRLTGMSYDRIGKQTGVTIGQAYKDVKAMLDEVNEKALEDAQHLRVVELTRLDRLLEKLEGAFKKKKKLKVIGRGSKQTTVEIEEQDIDITNFIYAYIRIMDRRSKYIAGLDAPLKTESDIGDRLKAVMEIAGEDVVEVLKRLAGEQEKEEA